LSLEFNDNNTINANALWNHIMQDLESCMTTPSFEMAIKPLGVRGYKDGILTLVTNNKMWAKAIKEKFETYILRALRKYSRNPEANFSVVLDKNYTFKYSIETEKREEKAPKEKTTQTQLPLNDFQIDALKFMESYNINVKYNFENFVVAPSNKYAFASAKTVANEPGKIYNPLFIWGGAGLGKTHLVNAIGKEILIKHPQLKLKYVTINDFTNEFTKIMYEYKGNPSLKNNFINKYRNVDVLLIDDAQFLEGRERTQDEVFGVFDFLHRNGKQIVITSDRQPKDIPTLTDRLRSRFEWGMLAEIKPPDFETRKEILKLKAKELEVSLSDDVIDLVATSFKQNVRELEGALNRLAGYISIEEKPVTIEVATEMLNLDALNKKLTINDIIDIVSEYYKIEPSEIKGDSRAKEIVTPRYISIYLARELTSASFPQIGSTFGNRKHATIVYAYEKTKQLLDTNHNLKLEINNFRSKIETEYFCNIKN